MNILFIGQYAPDYLEICVLHGLISSGHNVIDIPYINYLDKYSENIIDRNSLYGKGFSYAFTIEQNRSSIDRTNIEEKIAEHFFDIVIYGKVHANDPNLLQYIDLVNEKYNRGEIFCLDGDDRCSCNDELIDKYHKILYFKRELVYGNECWGITKNVLPISFAIPKSKFQKRNYNKYGEYIIDECNANAIYNINNQKLYTFDNEQQYYDHYNSAVYGLTCRKGGWDCMRHYEIIASYCLPIYMHFLDMPIGIMTTWPRDLQIAANSLYIDHIMYHLSEDQFSVRYYKLLDRFYDYAYENLTTENLAKYLLKFC